MPATPWEQQAGSYRAPAAEYEVPSYRDAHRAGRRMAALVRHLQPGGDLLEIACGTGLWTRHLAGCSATVTAIDAAPEMIALARQQVTAGNRDLRHRRRPHLGTAAALRHHLFAFWFSHVPAAELGQFWSLLLRALASGGRVLFVDDQPAAAALETYVAGSVRSWSAACATEPATGSSR